MTQAEIQALMDSAACWCSVTLDPAEQAKLELLSQILAGGGGGGGTPSLPLNSVQFNNAGAFGGSAELTFNDTTNVLQLIGSQNILQVVSNVTALTIAGHALSGANAQSMISGAGTWNTSGNPIGIRLAITDTASGATSKFLEFLGGAAGATSLFEVRKNGYTVSALGFAIGTAADITNVSGGDGLRFSTGFSSRWDILAAGHFVAQTDNVLDIGASGATRPRTGYFGTSLVLGTNASLSTATPVEINSGGTFADTVTGGKAKWKMYDAGGAVTSIYGMGITSGQFNFFTDAAADFVFHFADVEKARITSAAVVSPMFRFSTAFTVATLPVAGTQGRMAYVTDALTPTFLTLAVGGGAVVTTVLDNGSSWVTV